MYGKVFGKILVLLLCFLVYGSLHAQENTSERRNVLYISSYAMGYPWTDSLVSGIQKVFSDHEDIQLYIEFLDAKRFGRSQFSRTYELFRNKYRNIVFDAAITSDNDALDFALMFGDSLFPNIPVVFCGINNPQDYPLANSRYYGILDGVDMKTGINMILKVMPGIKKLYFITDESTTSLLNLGYIRKLEPEYARRLQFIYVHNFALDSLMHAVERFETGNAIALVNYYQDENGDPLNVDAVYKQIADRSPVPIFTDQESMLGKGLAGGIINSGGMHGREAAELTMKFIDDPGYKPAIQISLGKGLCYFDYNVLEKFNLSVSALPKGSIIINRPEKPFAGYLKYFIVLLGIIGSLMLIVVILFINISRRRKAETLVNQKLQEIQKKNVMLLKAHQELNVMNAELEKVKEHLSSTNQALLTAKEKSEESDKLKSAFLANMSHEIRTPLNAIIGFSSLLNDSLVSKKEREMYFRIISSNSDQLLRIIDDILDLSKIEAGQLTVTIESFSIASVLGELANTYIQSSMNNEVEIVLSPLVNKNKLLLKSDPVRFRQIFDNLLSNAMKFTRNGSVEVGYHLDKPGEITFYVKDTGIGISKKDMKHLFSRFWKADMREDKFLSGAGLGLAITKKLCETLGGKIWVESEPGTGTTFFIAFQEYCIDRMEQLPVNQSVGNGKENLSEYTIAVAEDEDSNLYLLISLLKKLQIGVITFTNGTEIVDYFRNTANKKVQMILMDIRMPDMDGMEATRLIREINPDIPIIAQTAYAMADDVRKLKLSIFTDYLIKPIRPEQLLEKIKKYLSPEPV